MAVIYVESTRTPGLRYRVLKFDPDTKQGKLIGDLGCEFTQDLSKASIEAKGYTLKAYEDADDPGLNTRNSTIPPPPAGMSSE